jgi:hypothetical protein
MTEAEWLAAERPLELLRYLHKATDMFDRKFRLFGVACCRRVAEQIPEFALSEVIDGCERLADNFVSSRLTSLRRTADGIIQRARFVEMESDVESVEYAMAVCQLTEYPIEPEHCADSCMQALCGHDDYDAGCGEMLFQVDLLRDIVGNPFRPVLFDPAWRTQTAVLLARGMYESRDFGAMPILADALQDAGCDNDDVLNHCRGPGPHVRGCWVVDLVLGKE